MLSDIQARALRIMTEGKAGVRSISGEIGLAIRDLTSTKFAAVCITAEGYRALREYDAAHADTAARSRIASGLSAAGRTALTPEQEGRDGHG